MTARSRAGRTSTPPPSVWELGMCLFPEALGHAGTHTSSPCKSQTGKRCWQRGRLGWGDGVQASSS